MTAPAPRAASGQLYWPDASNHCPGCGGRHWLVGRAAAECAFCAAALPLAAPPRHERPEFGRAA